jgi:protein gp37
MGATTEISWCDSTFNPWWGCHKVSAACRSCYAEAFAKRTGHNVWGEGGERRTFGEKHWNEPLKWNRQAQAAGVRRRVFCASMADVFEDHRIAAQERPRLWKLIASTPWLDWLLLTKRPENIRAMVPAHWLDAGRTPINVWYGCTVESVSTMDRISHLLNVPAVVRFISAEPLLEALDLLPYLTITDFNGRPCIHQVIVGGESGHKARPFQVQWARSIVEQCRAAGVAPFVKQMGADPRDIFEGQPPLGMIRLKNKKGADWSEWPDDLKVREWPAEFPEARP